MATDQRRGAEVFAADLVRRLEEAGVSQRVVTLRPGWLGVTYAAPSTGLTPAQRSSSKRRPHVDAVIRLRRIVRSWAPDVVQAHGGEAFKYCVLAGADRRAPLVYRRIGGAPSSLRSQPRRALHRWLMSRARVIVALAETVQDETISMFELDPDKVIMIPNGVDIRRLGPSTARTELRARLGLAPEAKVLLSLAALTWEKDPMMHVDVSCRVLARMPGAVHLIAGDGPMRSMIEQRVRSLGLGDRIRLLGSRADVPDLLSASDVLLFASRPDGMEGMPTVMIEAGMCGLAVAGFDVAGVGEVVLNGRTGVLVHWGAPKELADEIVALLSDDVRRRAMGEAGKEACTDRFDMSSLASRYLELYGKLAGRP